VRLAVGEGVTVGGSGLGVSDGARVAVAGRDVEEGIPVEAIGVGGRVGDDILPHEISCKRKKIIMK
jgi:hypothetical protein